MKFAPGTSPEAMQAAEERMRNLRDIRTAGGGKGGAMPQPTSAGGKGGSLPPQLARGFGLGGTSEDDYNRFMATVRFAPGAEIPTYEQWRDKRLAAQQNQLQPQQPVQDTYTEAVNAVPTVASVSKRPDPIMPTMMGQPTPAPETNVATAEEPTLTPSQLMGVVQSMGGKGGYRAPSFNPYASQGGFGYQPMSGGKGGYSQPAPNPYASQGGKGGYRAPTYNPYATQSPYVNYNQPSYNPAPAPSMGGKGSTQPQQPMTSGGKGGSMGGKGGTAGGKGG